MLISDVFDIHMRFRNDGAYAQEKCGHAGYDLRIREGSHIAYIRVKRRILIHQRGKFHAGCHTGHIAGLKFMRENILEICQS